MKQILIWGIGAVAEQVLHNGLNARIIGFLESNKTIDEYYGKRVYSIAEKLPGYDFIIVANTHSSEIYKTCLQRGIDLDKVIFLYGVGQQVGTKNVEQIKEILQEKNFTNYCCEFNLIEDTFFECDKEKYKELNRRKNFEIKDEYLWPVIQDKYAMAGTMKNYFWQDLWAARKINKLGIKNVFDIGSRIDGFIAHLLAMDVEVTLIDIREFPAKVDNLHTIVDDATLLYNIEDNSIGCISALCSLEHFGLGRYGDSVDPEACFKCFNAIQKKIKFGGHLFLAVPIGKERVEFNAHRVFFASTIIDEFSKLQLIEYSCAYDGKIEYNVDIKKYDKDCHNGEYRYGLFHFIKK